MKDTKKESFIVTERTKIKVDQIDMINFNFAIFAYYIIV